MPSFPVDWHLLWITTLRLGVAYLLAVPTGWWSEKEGHAVGIRTFPLVSVASCAYLMLFEGEGTDALAASSRVLQGLIAGIGFIGGGAILKDGMSVYGTATAASIWNFGAVGAAVAIGRYEIGIALAFLNLITMRALVPIKRKLDAAPRDR